MLIRRTLIMTLCAGIVVGLATALTFAEELSSTELFDKGMQQYSEGNLEQAQQTLRQVDPMDLTKDDRLELYMTQQDIDRKMTDEADVASLIAQAADAQKQGKLADASNLLNTANAHDDINSEQKAIVTARLAEVNRALKSDRTQLLQLIDQAEADVKANQLDAAQTKLQQVKDSGVDLGWFDNSRVDKQLAIITERQAEATAAAPAVVEEAPAAPVVVAEAKKEPAPAPVKEEAPAPVVEEKAPVAAPVAVVEEAPAAPAEPEVDQDLLLKVRQLESQGKVVAARKAELDQNYRLAVKEYYAALEFDPENEEAKLGLKNAQAKLEQVRPRSVIERDIATRELKRQATEAEFRELMNRSTQLYEAGNYDASREAVQQAKITLDRFQQFFAASQYATLREEATQWAIVVQQKQKEAEAERKRIQEQTAQEVAKQREMEATLRRQQEVQKLLMRAYDLRKDQKYDAAIMILEQALFLDPTNAAALTMKEIVEDTYARVEAKRLKRDRQVRLDKQTLGMLEATLPYDDLLTYPKDWPAITERRLSSLKVGDGDTEENRRVMSVMQSVVPVDFPGYPFLQVIDYFRQMTKLNIVVLEQAIEDAGYDLQMPITLKLSNVPFKEALEMVLDMASATNPLDPLTYTVENGIITISTESNLNTASAAYLQVYDIRDLLVQIRNFDDAPEFDLDAALSNTTSGGSGGGGGGGGGSVFGDSSQDQTDDVVPSREEMVTQITTLIQENIGKLEDWAEFGGEVSSLSELTGNLVVKTTADNHQDLIELLQQLRETRAIQISVEARFLLVDETFIEEVGVDLDMQFDPGDNWGPVQIAQDSYGMTQLGTGAQSIGQTPDAGALPPVTGEGSLLEGFGFEQTGRAFDLGVSYLNDIQVSLLVRATQQNNRTITLTAPRLTLFNGQRAYVMVARQVAFISELDPVTSEGAVAFNPTLSNLSEGVVLSVQATVSADRRYVTMEVEPSLSRLQRPIRQIPVFASAGGATGGTGGQVTPGLASGIIEAPELEVIQVKSTVSVPDKGTLLIGGQRVTTEIELEAGVPVLSRVPVLNRFFTNRSTQKEDRTLLVLIRPTIIIQSEEEDLLFPNLMDDPTNYRAGRRTLN